MVIFEMSTLEFVHNEPLTYTVNPLFHKVCCSLFLKVRVRVRVRFIKYANKNQEKRKMLDRNNMMRLLLKKQ